VEPEDFAYPGMAADPAKMAVMLWLQVALLFAKLDVDDALLTTGWLGW